MSDYNPTYTVQWRDYKCALTERDKWRGKVNRLRKKGLSLFEAIHKAGPLHTDTSLITEVRPNPLSMELRIVLGYFWKGFNKTERYIGNFRAVGRPVPPDLKVERQGYLDDVRNLCDDLFALTSPFYPVHIHSEHGCDDDNCPAWRRGYEAAQETVLEWYEPNC